MNGLYRLYRFLIHPANSVDGVLFLMLEILAPIVLLFILVRARRKGLLARITERPLYFAAPFLVVWFVPLITPLFNCLLVAGTGLVDNCLKRYARDIADMGGLNLVALWPLCALAALGVECDKRGTARARYIYGAAVFAVAAALGIASYYLWTPRLLFGGALNIGPRAVLLVGNLSTAAVILAFPLGFVLARLIPSAQYDAIVHETSRSEHMEREAAPPGLGVLIFCTVALYVAAVAYVVFLFPARYDRWLTFTSMAAGYFEVIVAKNDASLAPQGRDVWGPAQGWSTVPYNPDPDFTDSDMRSYRGAIDLLKEQAPLAAPYLVRAVGQVGSVGSVPAELGPSFTGGGVPYAAPVWRRQYYLTWISEAFEEGVTVTLSDTDGTVLRSVSHPEQWIFRSRQYWRAERSLIRETLVEINFTRSIRAFQDAERLWDDFHPPDDADDARVTNFPPFVVPINNEVAGMKIGLYTSGGQRGNSVEVDISRIQDVLGAAAGSKEALARLARSTDSTENYIACLALADGGIVHMPGVQIDLNGPKIRPDGPTLRDWFSANTEHLVWDENKKAWTLEDDGAEGAPENSAVPPQP
ncbi:MAG: hypothetical protein ACYTAN_16345 [Planctomycetota bacterium]|jgi:hypothetical protein